MPNIFISHSNEDNEVARRLANYLRRDGADVWIHYTQLVVESNLPKAIRKAIAWSDVMVLVWSNSAASSSCIHLELYSALMFKKRIILCQMDATKRWDNLEGFQHIDFIQFDHGYFELIESLQMNLSEDILDYLYQNIQVSAPAQFELANSLQTVNFANDAGQTGDPIDELIEAPILMENDPSATSLYRRQPKQLSEDEVATMLERHNFFDKRKNENGFATAKAFEIQEINGEAVIVDSESGLMWQKSGSLRSMWFESAQQWIAELNRTGYAGYDDWRLPTLEEAMSLTKKERRNGDIYIDAMFDKNQTSIWTADVTMTGSRAWVVFFNYGSCFPNCFDFNNYVRAVRSYI